MGKARQMIVKRALDVVGSTLCLAVLAIPMGVIWILVRVKTGPPAILKQVRPGLSGRPFVLYKFRTMTNARDDDGFLLSDERRLTKLGRSLRRTSLDELPELLNVLIGDMSLVGPRPLLVEYLDRYSPEQARRHEMRPGMTGWAQTNGRNALTWDEKFALDVWYVDNWSFSLDLRILTKTVIQVARGNGISAEGYSTMPRYMGHPIDEAES